MRRAILVAAAAALMSGTSFAADLPANGPIPYYSATPVVGGYNWAGPYAGLNVGYEWGRASGSDADPKGIAGGLQAGYNWQSGSFIFGAETDLQLSGADDTFANYKFSNPWFGTLRARAGYAMNNILFYGTFGIGYGDLKAELGGATEVHTLAGWAGGLGAEVGFTPNWSVRMEYLYMDLGARGFSLTSNDNGLRANFFRFGVNYHF
jgi:outer membrane immunogenic protein